jgi:hypothetical protein
VISAALTLEEKRCIATDSYAVPRQVWATARRNGLSTSQCLRGVGWLGMGAPRGSGRGEDVRVGGDRRGGSPCSPPLSSEQLEAVGRNLSPPACSTTAPGRIAIGLVRGYRVIVNNGVDAAVVARVFAVLDRP